MELENGETRALVMSPEQLRNNPSSHHTAYVSTGVSFPATLVVEEICALLNLHEA